MPVPSPERAFRPPRFLLEERQVSTVKRERYLRQFTQGQAFTYLPRPGVQGPDPRAGETVTVVRAPRTDVKSASVRVRFADGEERTVRPAALKRKERPIYPPSERTPGLPHEIEQARSLPVWERILNLLEIAYLARITERDQLSELRGLSSLEAQLSGTDPDAEASRVSVADLELGTDLQRRLSQVASMVLPRTAGPAEREAFSRTLLGEALLDVQRRRALRPGRAGKPLPPAPRPTREPTDTVTAGQLEQEQRRMLNVIARCIHLRYFLSDLASERLSEEERREKRAQAKAARQIRAAQKAEGLLPVTNRGVRASVPHGELQDATQAMYAASLEVCQALTMRRESQIPALLERYTGARDRVLRAQAELQALRPAVETGRFFHGDILSVRDEHAVYDEEGRFLGYEGMTQFYTRLTVIHAGDGFTVEIANGHEIEVRTGVRVAEGWQDLCRWIKDQSERGEGRRQGRRQDDDRHLVFEEDRGHLTLRESVRRHYPGMVSALEAVRRSLDPELSDVADEEIPDGYPVRGYHPPQRAEQTDGACGTATACAVSRAVWRRWGDE